MMCVEVRSRSAPLSVNCQTTTVEARISIKESRPKPARATECAASAAIASTPTPTTFHPSVTYSSHSPRCSRSRRADADAAPVEAGTATSLVTRDLRGRIPGLQDVHRGSAACLLEERVSTQHADRVHLQMKRN